METIRILILIGFFSIAGSLWAQSVEFPFKTSTSPTKKDTTSSGNANRFTLNAYGDLYLGFATGLPNKKPGFLYNHKINNQVRANLLLIQGAYEAERFHAKVGLMTGDYVRFNLKEEPLWAKPWYEAYVGLLPSVKTKLWLDAGIFSSYIGFENPITTENTMLTRSIVADNTPYYFSGIRGQYRSKGDRYEVLGFVLNGWQRIAWNKEQAKPSYGLSVKRMFTPKASLSYGVFYGTVYPDSLKMNRLYQQVIGSVVKETWTYFASVDVGIEKGYLWGAAQITAQWRFHDAWAFSQRIETFVDPHNRCVNVGATTPSQFGAVALCLEHKMSDALSLRLEPKCIFATEPIIKGKTWEIQTHASLAFRL